MLIQEGDLAKSAGDPFDASPWLIWPGINADCMKFWSLKAIVYLPYLLKVLLLSFFSHPQPNESCQQNRTTVSMPEAERLPLGKLPPEYRRHFFPEPGAHCCCVADGEATCSADLWNLLSVELACKGEEPPGFKHSPSLLEIWNLRCSHTPCLVHRLTQWSTGVCLWLHRWWEEVHTPALCSLW